MGRTEGLERLLLPLGAAQQDSLAVLDQGQIRRVCFGGQRGPLGFDQFDFSADIDQEIDFPGSVAPEE